MAKSKHRKAHKQALAHWKSVHVPEPPRERAQVTRMPGKTRQTCYPVDENSVVITVNGVAQDGTVDTDRGVITLSSNVKMDKGDRVKLDYPLGRPDRNGDVYRLEANPGRVRGRAEHLMTFDDAASWPGGGRSGASEPHGVTQLLDHCSEMADFTPDQNARLTSQEQFVNTVLKDESVGLVGADYTELEKRVLAAHPLFPSMARIMDPAPGNHHLEMAWHKDENGQPVFDEISLCDGPDPNGLTTI